MNTKTVFALLFLSTFILSAQKSKVQSAWRALSDYESTEKDGKPDVTYLKKAKESIDAALANPETKHSGKAYAYKARICYAFYKIALTEEKKKLEASIQDKNEREMTAYGKTPVEEFEHASDQVNLINEWDPKYMQTITDGISKGTSTLSEDDIKFVMLVQQLKIESGNIAQGKYKARQYDDASDYFYKTAIINSLVLKFKDTANFHNATVCASKSHNTARILEYNKKMIDLNIASAYNFESMYNAYIAKGDTAAAYSILQKGRTTLPNDPGLVTLETNHYLSSGRSSDALKNLNIALEKDPKNGLLYLVTGNIYDNMANPKDKNGKEMDKPDHFEELYKKAEANYLKAIEFAGTNKELAYNANYNTGAMYNNYGGYLQGKKANTITEQVKMQKENEIKSQEYYKKAIPFLEKALDLKPDDKATMVALRKLYLLTGNEAKAKVMNEKIKSN
jgi:hypothetical protein